MGTLGAPSSVIHSTSPIPPSLGSVPMSTSSNSLFNLGLGSMSSIHMITPSPSSILHTLPPSPLTLRLGMTPSPLPLSPSPLLQNFPSNFPGGQTPTPPPGTFSPIPMSSSIPSSQSTSIYLPKPTQPQRTSQSPQVQAHPAPVRPSPVSISGPSSGTFSPPQAPSQKKSGSHESLTLAPMRS